MKVVKTELENDRIKMEEMSAMNNFNSRLGFFFFLVGTAHKFFFKIFLTKTPKMSNSFTHQGSPETFRRCIIPLLINFQSVIQYIFHIH